MSETEKYLLISRISCFVYKTLEKYYLISLHLCINLHISGAVPASEAVSVELVLADEAGHARGVPPLGPRHDRLPPLQPPRDEVLQRRLLPLRLGRRHCAPRIGVRIRK